MRLAYITVGGVDVDVAARGAGESDAAGRGREVVDRVSGAREWLGGYAEVSLVPEVDACFVADLDGCVDVGEDRACVADRQVLGFVGGVGGVEVEDVVVADPDCGSRPSRTFQTV